VKRYHWGEGKKWKREAEKWLVRRMNITEDPIRMTQDSEMRETISD